MTWWGRASVAAEEFRDVWAPSLKPVVLLCLVALLLCVLVSQSRQRPLADGIRPAAERAPALRRRVFVIGDSTATPLQEAWSPYPELIAVALGSGYQVITSSRSGRRMLYVQNAAVALDAEHRMGCDDWLIVGLGTNDVKEEGRSAALQAARAMSQRARSERWPRPLFVVWFPDRGASQLRQFAHELRDVGLRVVGVELGRAEYRDEHHPNQAGQDAVARALQAAILAPGETNDEHCVLASRAQPGGLAGT